MSLNPPKNQEAATRIFTARVAVNAKLPYLRSITNALLPVEVPGLGTVATTPGMHFMYDPEFLLRITDPLELGGIWLHEQLHHLKMHLKRMHVVGLTHDSSREDLHLWNVAGDLENNRDVEAAGFKLPCKPTIDFDPCFARNFRDVNGKTFPDNLSAEEYFAMLREVAQAEKGKPAPKPGGKDAGAGGVGTPPPTAGNAPGNVSAPPPPGKAQIAGGACGGACGARVDGEPEGTAQSGRTPADVAAIRGECARALRDHIASKGEGSVPGGLVRWAEKADEVIPIPWWVLLTRACQQAVAFAAGKTEYHYTRPSRRQGGLGYGVGKPIVPATRRPIPTIWIGVDSSGSMGAKDVSVVLTVVEDVMRVSQKKVTFFSCDTQINAMKEVASWRDAVDLIVGGGGTDFRPVFETAKSARPEKRPQVLIFVTDGQGPAPEVAPLGIKVIWILVGRYAQAPCDWGDQIRIEADVKAPA